MRELLRFQDGVQGAIWYAEPLGHVYQSHHHAELEFNLVTRGTARYVLEQNQYELAADDAVWLFPAHEHVLMDMSMDFQMWILCIHPNQLRRHCRTARWAPMLAEAPAGRWCRRLPEAAVAEVVQVLQVGLQEKSRPPVLRNAGLVHAALSCWDLFLAAGEPVRGVAVHPAVERAIPALVRDEWPELPELAAHCGLSYSRLTRLFKQATGESLADFRNRCRLQRFLDRWDPESGQTLLSVALAVGFGSYAHFHRVFRQHMGCGPREWNRNE